ncbi:MAG: aminotransferase class I/II-fold pyridoxal phosphate-dependent enzyme [Odoribacteraceae bacterium]|nr:aminotransferase class I/II-fold pyridoxal phosphate-dependent enzyme [Odoribacteraceae bacterium]
MTHADPTPGFHPARRLEAIHEYYFSRKLKEIAAMNAAGADVINLGIGSPDTPPDGAVIETLCREARRADTHGYQSYAGIPELREAFAGWYRRWYGVELDATREVLPLIGSKEGILHVSLAFLDPGDEVLVPDPGYPTYSSATRLAGGVPVPYALHEEREWAPDWEALERRDLSRVKLMWANYPHMPTGAPATREIFERLTTFGRRHGIVVCHDNPYSFILNDSPGSILAVEGARECCIEMNSLSKSHNMPGWRVAMLASNARFVEWILKVKSNVDSGQFRPVMLAAAQALEAGREWYVANNRMYAARREVAEEIMRALHCSCRTEQRGLFLWGRVADEWRDGEEMGDEVLRRARVFITPGVIFGNNGNRYARISLCCREERLREALARIRSGW